MIAPLAIVTGATGTLGGAVVKRLWRTGWSVLALGRSPEKLQGLHDWLNTAPHGERQVHYTVAMEFPGADYARVAAYCECHQRLDGEVTLLVVCHGADPCVKPTLDLTTEEVEHVWQTDVLATLRLCQAIGRVMIAQRDGAIVIVSSVHSTVTYPERTAYSLAKSALSGLVRSLAVEWGVYGVRTNAILPWQCTGERTDSFIAGHREITGEDLGELYRQRSPMRRLILPGEVADAVLFLADNQAVNGHELVLDGGVIQSMWYQGFVSPTEAKDERCHGKP